MNTETTGKQQAGRFRPGRSGNPAGRPKGARNKATLAAEALLDGEAVALTRKAIEMALEGDMTAMRLCMERLLPPRRDRPVAVPLPQITTPEDATKAAGIVLAGLSNGTLTPSEAVILTGLIEAQRRASAVEVPPPTASPVAIQVQFVSPGG